MKTTILAFLGLMVATFTYSQQSTDVSKNPATVAKSIKKSTISGGAFELSIGGGQLNPTSVTSDSLGFSPMQTLNGEIKIKHRGWDGVITGKNHALISLVLGGGVLLNESLPTTAASAYKVSGSTDTGLLTEFGTEKSISGYNFEIGPEITFSAGDFELSGSVGFGYLKTTQKPVSLMQGVSNSAYPALIKILSRPEITNSGFQYKPAFRISYTPSSIGFWLEANYLSGPEMTTRSYYLTPSGRSGADGYKIDQLLSGSTTEIVRKNKFEAFGVNAGVTLALDKKKKPKPKPVGGQDDDCDGLVTVNEEIIMENGNVLKRIVQTETYNEEPSAKLSTIKNNPLYKETVKPNNPLSSDERKATADNTKDQNSPSPQKDLMNESRMQPAENAGCGAVSQKTTLPDGTVEEMIFACPDDAIYYRKQTQGASFGEKTVEKATSGLKDTLKTQVRVAAPETSSELKTKHDTAKNSINNVR